jgi:hypothetical protein
MSSGIDRAAFKLLLFQGLYMPRKNLLIKHLKELISIAERSENYDDAISKIRRINFIYPFWDVELERRLRRLDQKIDELLERPSSSCRFENEYGDKVFELMTAANPNGRVSAIHHMNESFYSAEKLTICDPYFLCKIKDVDSYLKNIDMVIPTTVKAIDLYINKSKCDTDVQKAFNNLCQKRSIKLTCLNTDKIHDRVWIIDSSRAFIVGTSFNGIGKRITFILALPETDKVDFIKESLIYSRALAAFA